MFLTFFNLHVCFCVGLGSFGASVKSLVVLILLFTRSERLHLYFKITLVCETMMPPQPQCSKQLFKNKGHGQGYRPLSFKWASLEEYACQL